jgi:hypothetical protein
MVPVTLFRSNDKFGVLPINELDGDEVEEVVEFDRFSYGPALFLPAMPLASCGGKGSFAAAGTGRAAIPSVVPAAPLPPLLFAASGRGSARCGERKRRKGGHKGVPAMPWKRMN